MFEFSEKQKYFLKKLFNEYKESYINNEERNNFFQNRENYLESYFPNIKDGLNKYNIIPVVLLKIKLSKNADDFVIHMRKNKLIRNNLSKFDNYIRNYNHESINCFGFFRLKRYDANNKCHNRILFTGNIVGWIALFGILGSVIPGVGTASGLVLGFLTGVCVYFSMKCIDKIIGCCALQPS